MPPEVDEMLEAYLGEAQPDGTRRAARGKGSDPAPDRVMTTQGRAERPGGSSLEDLLSVYLETIDGGKPEDSKFALPRSSDVDELLRRYVLDQEDVSGALECSLRQHLTSEHAMIRPDSSPEAWAREMASALRQTGDLDQRLNKYASAVAEHDEKEHAFSADQESTLKGVPPPNAPPIALGSELAKTIREKTKSGDHSPIR